MRRGDVEVPIGRELVDPLAVSRQEVRDLALRLVGEAVQQLVQPVRHYGDGAGHNLLQRHRRRSWGAAGEVLQREDLAVSVSPPGVRIMLHAHHEEVVVHVELLLELSQQPPTNPAEHLLGAESPLAPGADVCVAALLKLRGRLSPHGQDLVKRPALHVREADQ
eukprot:768344-Hanusia_phi.AAC.11